MNPIKKIYCRAFQIVFRIALPILPYRNPKIKKSLSDIIAILDREGVTNPLIITDSNLSKIGATDALKKIMDDAGIKYAFWDKAFPNPTTDIVADAAAFYTESGCDSIIAYGGGSPMDVAKACGVMVTYPNKPLSKFAGILKVRKKLPLLVAIPTTAGTGSETTLASVIVDADTRHKFTINSFPLIPKYTILDSITIHTLPMSIASTTGLDALTHAVEAYIGRSTNKETRSYSKKAVRLIFDYLDDSCNHVSSKAEFNMLKASHYAGRAFTRSYVGYVHAISHSLSGQYNLPHGYTNAILLPIILRKYGDSITEKLSELALSAGLGKKEEEMEVLAERFISAIEDMNKKYGLPDKFDVIREEDIPLLASYADKEANPLYPVPVLWDAKALAKIYEEVMA